MKLKIAYEYKLLILLFIFILGFRLYFVFQTNHFNNDEAYFHLRSINHILSEKTLFTYDNLSYGGRLVLYPPLFHILMGLLSFGSIFLLKLIPEIFISLTVFIVYFITKDMVGNSYTALFASLLSGFYPILFSETLNNLSVYTLVIPLILIMLYSLLNLEKKFYLWCFVVSSFLLPLIHPSAFIFIFTVFIYLFLLLGGALNPTKLKKEAIIFSFLLILLLEFAVYKKAFLQYGFDIMWQNIPSNILSDSFRKLAPLDLLIGVGFLPLVFGSFGIYLGIVKNKVKSAYMYAAFSIAVILLIVFRFLTISIGLMFLGFVLCIFSAYSLNLIYDYLNKLKFNYVKNIFTVLLLILFLSTSFIPSFLAARESNNIANSKIKEVNWININTPEDAVILGNIDEGNLINVIGKRKNVLDDNFLLAPDPIQRSEDMKTIYTTVSEAIAVNLIKKYGITLIYLSDETKDTYSIDNLKYAENSNCFTPFREATYYVFKC